MTEPSTLRFREMSQDAQIARLTAFAQGALKAFGLAGAALTFFSYTNNTLFKVQHGDAAYVLRVHRPALKTAAWIRSELAWLTALNQNTTLMVPQPAAGLYTGTMDGVEGPVYAVLFRWIEGESIPADALTGAHIAQIGQFAAQLHAYSTNYAPPEDFVRPHLNFDGLFGENSPYNAGEAGERLIIELGGSTIAEVIAQVHDVMDGLTAQPESYGLIHADLLPKNLLWHEGRAGAVDFDDCAFGYYLYDLAPILLGFKSHPRYEENRDVLWSSYAEARRLHSMPFTDLETLIAGRYVASIRWVAGNTTHPAIRDRAPQIISERIIHLQDFLNTGTLKLV